MKIKSINYWGDHSALYFEDQGILLYNGDKTELGQIDDEKLKKDYFYYIIQGHWCDGCTNYNDISDGIEIEIIEI